MSPGPTMFSAAVILLAAGGLSGCSLEAAMESCAACGEVRSISPRQTRNEIRLLTDAPRTIAITDAAAAPVVYDVRIRMDRGGSRDLILSDATRLRVGDRVEIRAGQVVPLPSGRDSWS